MKPAELIEEAKKFWKQCNEAESDIRKEYLEDMRMYIGDQWPQQAKDIRGSDRPTLTINRIPQFVRQVTNDIRQNRPVPKASPIGDGSSKETADIVNGLVRHIIGESGSIVAVDTATTHQVAGSFGFFRVITDYQDDQSFDQDIRLSRIANPLTVHLDPDAVEPDYSDGRRALIEEDFTEEGFKQAFPNAKLSGLGELAERGGDPWVQEKSIKVVEYFKVISEEATLYLLSTGETTTKKPEDETLIQKIRKIKQDKVMIYKLSATEILEESEWAGKYIPIIPVLGEEQIIEGKKYLISLTRYARDPQRMLNYWESAKTEMIALAPKAPFIMAEGQDENYEAMWDNANTRNYSRLIYKPTTIAGQPLPPPQRNTYEPPVQAMVQGANMASQFLKDTTGIYDASLGAHSNETSGKAIIARQKEGDVSTYHFVDNLARSMRYLGKILLDLIPKIYDAPRIIRIVHPDSSEEQVAINQETEYKGMKALFDFTAGRYDVVMETGPSYATKRQQMVDSMAQVSQAYPALWQIAGDIMVRAMDWPDSDILADRLKAILPPQIQQAEANKGQQIPPQLQQQMAQMHDMLNKLTQELNASATELDSMKRQEQIKKMEIKSRERIATMQAQVDLIKTHANIEGRAHIAAFQTEIDFLKKRLDLLNMERPIEDEEEELPPMAMPQGAQPDMVQSAQ